MLQGERMQLQLKFETSAMFYIPYSLFDQMQLLWNIYSLLHSLIGSELAESLWGRQFLKWYEWRSALSKYLAIQIFFHFSGVRLWSSNVAGPPPAHSCGESLPGWFETWAPAPGGTQPAAWQHLSQGWGPHCMSVLWNFTSLYHVLSHVRSLPTNCPVSPLWSWQNQIFSPVNKWQFFLTAPPGQEPRCHERSWWWW